MVSPQTVRLLILFTMRSYKFYLSFMQFRIAIVHYLRHQFYTYLHNLHYEVEHAKHKYLEVTESWIEVLAFLRNKVA